jgi:glycine betaine/choline ABC-type transport system substrate-binding protein
MSDENLTPEQVEQLLLEKSDLEYPSPVDKPSIYAFLMEAMYAEKEQLSKVGNINDVELGALNMGRGIANYAQLMGMKLVGQSFHQDVDSYLALSDSKNGFLVNAAITQKKETSHKTPKEKRGWFGIKKQE